MSTAASRGPVIGAAGKTGAHVARKLTHLGVDASSSRSGTDVWFDWHNPSTIGAALRGAEALCVVAPVLQLDLAGHVAAFPGSAQSAGVRQAKGAVL